MASIVDVTLKLTTTESCKQRKMLITIHVQLFIKNISVSWCMPWFQMWTGRYVKVAEGNNLLLIKACILN